MEVYRRGDDHALYDWYTSLYTEPDKDIARLVSESRSRYPLRITPMESQTVLCISHAKRMIINARQNTAFAAVHEANGLHTRHIEWEGEALKGTTCQPQSMTIWEGIHLIGCPRGSGKAALGVVQGVVYSVQHRGRHGYAEAASGVLQRSAGHCARRRDARRRICGRGGGRRPNRQRRGDSAAERRPKRHAPHTRNVLLHCAITHIP